MATVAGWDARRTGSHGRPDSVQDANTLLVVEEQLTGKATEEFDGLTVAGCLKSQN